ncbi:MULTISPECIES: ABC transporter permease [Rhizobium/Agrobacterium group]|uniref:Dipeptide ABC transporter n=1 Tax=Agrobacterium tumefaciens str. Kerr 14 TaxID=1183424 RepID=A0A1S7SDB1_AGRTU|nr:MULTISPECIES: ABC transporter permease [Rhizobium/Agrobacterium group]NTF97806.1 ABC transporter permease [Rhizobium rhizogenes]CUX67026.1 Dipeptide ABC transporter [Agrobacterium tumefaciens str. Kerr 14]
MSRFEVEYIEKSTISPDISGKSRAAGRVLRLGISYARKFAAAFLVLFAAITLVFFSLQLAPGDVVDALVGDAGTDISRAAAVAEWGLDKPLYEQYTSYVARVLTGDFGQSYTMAQPVTKVISDRIWPTFELAGAAGVIAIVIALIVTILTGTGARWAARLSSFVELVLVSTPTFWLGILLIFFVSFKWNLLPVVSGNRCVVVILPASALGLRMAGELIQIMRNAIGKAVNEPFALSAKARGISDIGFSLRHGLRHAALPAITVSGWLIGSLLTGTFVVEHLFGRSGIGSLTVKAVLARDTPVVMGVSILAAAVYVAVSTLVDILYVFVDPRLKDGKAGGR